MRAGILNHTHFKSSLHQSTHSVAGEMMEKTCKRSFSICWKCDKIGGFAWSQRSDMFFHSERRRAVDRRHFPQLGCGNIRSEAMHQAKIIDEIQVGRAGATVSPDGDVDSRRQHFTPAMWRVRKICVRPRTINHRCPTGGQEPQLVVIAIIHMRQDGGNIEQADVVCHAYGSADETWNGIVPRVEIPPEFSKRPGMFGKKRRLIGCFGQMRRQRNALIGRATAAATKSVHLH